MELISRGERHLPALAWCLSIAPGGRAELLHGPHVEVSATGFSEGAWDGDFGAGRPDDAVTCMGSGGRVGGDEWVLAAPSHTLESLYHVVRDGRLHVSNSLVFLLVRAGLSLDPGYRRYLLDLRSVAFGLSDCLDGLRTAEGVQVTRHLACNLHIDAGLRIRRIAKPLPPRFADFAAYRAFLRDSLARLAANAADVSRTRSYRLLASVSRGYDSPACATLAGECGCSEAVTIRDSSWGTARSDDGTAIAERIGLTVHGAALEDYLRRPGPTEAEFVAMGDAGDVQFAALEDRLAGRMLVTGVSGDDLWNPGNPRVGTELVRGTAGGSSLGEFRLRVGFIHVPLPTVGARSHPEIHRISRSTEMDPWRVGGAYDRPIPRRIAEERGVPRDWFGRGKSATAVWWTLRPPKAESLRAYARFRAERARTPARLAEESLHRGAYAASRAWFRATRLSARALRKLGLRLELPQVVPRRFSEPADQDMLVQWGVSVVAARYAVARAAPATPAAGKPVPAAALS